MTQTDRQTETARQREERDRQIDRGEEEAEREKKAKFSSGWVGAEKES